VPTIVVILGEGGSGGALAIGIGDRVLMMENAVYSVITPEGCAAILWKDAGQSSRAAECLRLTPDNLIEFGLIDEIVSELTDWKFSLDEDSDQQMSYKQIAENLKASLLRHLKELNGLDVKKRMELRFRKFRKMGSWIS